MIRSGRSLHQVVPGDDLLLGVGGEGVGAGKVHQPDLPPPKLEEGLFLLHRHAGPVPHVEPGAGNGVDQGRLPGVRVTGNRYRYTTLFHRMECRLPLHFSYFIHCLLRLNAHPIASTPIPSASFFRSERL